MKTLHFAGIIAITPLAILLATGRGIVNRMERWSERAVTRYEDRLQDILEAIESYKS